jgi:hypothetical protein
MPNEPSYPPAEVERALQRGDLHAAQHELGWFGDEWSYRLVRTGGGLQEILVVVDKDVASDLGLDLSNDAGVATVEYVAPQSTCGRGGQLRKGDIVRSVNGATCFTCEAVVKAIKLARGRLELSALRPPPTQAWREEANVVAGSHCVIRFEVTTPSCLLYRFKAAAHDVGFSIARLGRPRGAKGVAPGGAKGDAHKQVSLRTERAGSGEGHVLLLQPGTHAVGLDNSYSIWRSKQVRYALRLLPMECWEAGQQSERLTALTAEVAERKARSAELKEEIAHKEARATALREELLGLETSLEQAAREREENRARWKEAKAERAALLSHAEQQGEGAAAGRGLNGAARAADPPLMRF